MRPNLDVAQDAQAEDHGIRFTVQRAAFSGTATWLELKAEVTQQPFGSRVVRVVVPANAFTEGSVQLAPGGSSMSIGIGIDEVVRLGPPDTPSAITLEFTTVQLLTEDGSQSFVSGNWRLVLDTPDDLVHRLRTEHLSGDSVQDAGVRVAIEGAARSVTETLVTVRVDSEEILNHLGEPALFVGGNRLTGGLIASQEEGHLLTYSFPPTSFGSDAELRFGPFVKAGAEETGSATVDIGAVMARNVVQGKNEETVAILPADHVASSGRALTVTSMWFSDLYNSSEHPGKNRTVRFTVQGSFPGQPNEVFEVYGPKGPLTVVYGGWGYSKDASGAISSPRTDVGVLYNSLSDLDGEVTILVHAREEELIRGDWNIVLRPAP